MSFLDSVLARKKLSETKEQELQNILAQKKEQALKDSRLMFPDEESLRLKARRNNRSTQRERNMLTTRSSVFLPRRIPAVENASKNKSTKPKRRVGPVNRNVKPDRTKKRTRGETPVGYYDTLGRTVF